MHSKHSRRRTCKHAPSHKNQKQLEANFNVQEEMEEANKDVFFPHKGGGRTAAAPKAPLKRVNVLLES